MCRKWTQLYICIRTVQALSLYDKYIYLLVKVLPEYNNLWLEHYGSTGCSYDQQQYVSTT